MSDPKVEELKVLIAEQGRLVVFVGAGVSAAAGLPSWSRVVQTLSARASNDTQREVAALVARRALIDALSAIRHELGLVPFCEQLASLLDDQGKPVPELARAVVRLKPRLVVTTNLDHILERAFEGNWPAISRMQQDSARLEKKILKIHGTLSERETWVFTRAQYDDAVHDPNLQDTVDALYRAHPILFLGYGLEDDDFDRLIARVRNFGRGGNVPKHYAIFPRGELLPSRHRQLAAGGVQIIEYDNAASDHAALLSLLRELAGDVEARDSSKIAGPSQVPAADTDTLLAQIKSLDPCICMPAGAALAERTDGLELIEAIPIRTWLTAEALRVVTRRRPAAAAKSLLGRISKADSNWSSAVAAAASLAVEHEDYVDELYPLLKEDGAAPIDVQRLAIEAVGRSRRRTMAATVVETANFSDYSVQKLKFYVALCLARLFANERDDYFLQLASDRFLKAIEADGDVAENSRSELRLIFRQCTGAHVDVLIKAWLPCQHSAAELAIETLGHRRFSRAVPALSSTLSSTRTHLHLQASEALGTIASEAAVNALLQYSPLESRGFGLAMVIDRIQDASRAEAIFDEILKRASFHSLGLAFMSAGRRRESRFAEACLAALDHDNSFVRACAALALARSGGKPHADRLVRATEEAADAFEHIGMMLALIELDPANFARYADTLRSKLAESHSHTFHVVHRLDVLSVLTRSQDPRAQTLAKAWTPFYV